MNALEKNLLGVPFKKAHTLLPGLILSAAITWLSLWLSEFIGVSLLGFEKSPISSVVVAILLGMLVKNLVRLPAWFNPGIQFAIKKLLRLGIILLGIRLSIFDVFKLGASGLPIVLLTITFGVVLTTLLARAMHIPERLGTLIGVGTSICGASAIVATAPAIDADDEEVAYAVAVITMFGIAATLLYPYLANVIFAADPLKAGLFLGTAIHETAQVAGAGMVYQEVFASPAALEAATVTKLVRNVFMAAVIPLMSFYYARRSAEFKGKKISIAKLLPLFIIGFLLMAVLRSIGDAGVQAGRAFGIWDAAAWKTITGTIKSWAEILFVLALAGVGLNTSYQTIKGLGIKPFLVGLFAALLVGLVSYLAIVVLVG
jgi:uncharacterized integral membrane protein (TIGR00698 family)